MTLLECAEKIRAIFSNPRTLEEARTEARHFTRDRKMPFERLLEYLLHGSKGAAQSVLNEFFQGLEEGIHMTQQALSKARNHFDRSPFLKAFYEIHQFPTFVERYPAKNSKIQSDIWKFATFQGSKTEAVFLRV